jgi:hypothetical protein
MHSTFRQTLNIFSFFTLSLTHIYRCPTSSHLYYTFRNFPKPAIPHSDSGL